MAKENLFKISTSFTNQLEKSKFGMFLLGTMFAFAGIMAAIIAWFNVAALDKGGFYGVMAPVLGYKTSGLWYNIQTAPISTWLTIVLLSIIAIGFMINALVIFPAAVKRISK